MNPRDDSLIPIAVVVLALLVSAPRIIASETGPGDVKMARVNEAVIFKSEVDRDVNLILRKASERGQSISEDKLSDIRKKSLEDLVNRELLYQEGLRQKISIDPNEVDKQFELIKSLYSDEKILSDKLSFMRLSESEMKSLIQKNLIVRRFLNDTIASGVYITEEESRDFYNKNKKKFRQAEKIRASHIMVGISPDAGEPEKMKARNKIENILKRIQNGEKFSDLAKKFSEGPAGEAGGELGYVERKNMAKPFSDAAFPLNIGETSGIIETRLGFHLIQVLDKIPERDSNYEETKKEVDRLLAQKKLNEKIKTCLDKLRQQARIEIFGNETSSKSIK